MVDVLDWSWTVSWKVLWRWMELHEKMNCLFVRQCKSSSFSIYCWLLWKEKVHGIYYSSIYTNIQSNWVDVWRNQVINFPRQLLKLIDWVCRNQVSKRTWWMNHVLKDLAQHQNSVWSSAIRRTNLLTCLTHKRFSLE